MEDLDLQVLRLFPAWLMCAAAGSLYGWSALGLALEREFGVSMAATGLVFSYAVACFTIAVIFAPSIMNRFAARNCLIAFGVLACAFLAIAALASTYAMFVLGFSVGFGTMSGAIYITALSVSASSGSATVATPVMVAGFGLGGAVLGPVWRLLDQAGWGLDGIWVLIVVFLVSIALLWCTPASRTEPSKQVHSENAEVFPRLGSTMVLLWVVFACGSFAGLMVLGLAARMMEHNGATVSIAAWVLAGIAVGNTIGRFSVALINQLNRPLLSLGASVAISGLGIVLALAELSALGVALCLMAFGYGMMASGVPSATQALFGGHRFAQVFAVVFTAWGVSGFVAPWVGGAVFDGTGQFTGALWIAALALIVSAISIGGLVRQGTRGPVSAGR